MPNTQFTDNLNIISESNLEIELLDGDLSIIQKLDDEPNDVGGLSAQQLKAKFDESGITIQRYINEKLIPAVLAEHAVEVQRAANEAQRQENEAQRIGNENARQTAESGRAKNEQTRTAAENTRAANESARVAAEAIRFANEEQRVTDERGRASAESARANAESLRAAAEDNRAKAENNRATTEINRAAAENTRQTNEAARIAAEQARVDENTGIVARATAQANAAAQSASAASTSATGAANSASSASTSAAAASQSARDADTSRRGAAEAATTASTSRDAAAQSASKASTSEKNAADSASAAQNSAASADTSAKNAASAATDAAAEAVVGVENRLSGYVDDAKAAKIAAEQARDEAQAIAGGDFMAKNIYDPQGKSQDVFKYVDDAVQKINVFVVTVDAFDNISATYAEIYEAFMDGSVVFMRFEGNYMVLPLIDVTNGRAVFETVDITNGQMYRATVTSAGVDVTELYGVPITPEMLGVESEVFIATYNTTTTAEIEAAWQAGKAVYCRNGPYMALLTRKNTPGNRHIFTYYASGEQGEYLCEKNVWSSSVTAKTENWTFTLEDGTTVTKAVYVND